jgi:hypothetical protein
MNHPEKLEIGFLIELAITGQADAKQFDEVMDRVEKEPETAALYQQALAEHRLLQGQLQAVDQKLAQDQANQAERLRAQAIEEELRLQLENDLGLGM